MRADQQNQTLNIISQIDAVNIIDVDVVRKLDEEVRFGLTPK